MAGRYGDKNPPMKYYDDYRNKYYNPDDEINRPGRNVNWKDIQQGFSLAAAKDDEQDTSIAELEEKNTEQDGRLDTLEETAANHDTRLDAIETEQTEQNGRLTAIETEQVEQNSRLDAIETKDSEQDAAIAAIRAKDTDQDTAIGNLTEDISDLETRMSDAEQDIQNENQRNTAQDQSISDNSVRITRLESSQTTQDQQIASLITTSVDHGAAINNLNQQVAAAAGKVQRIATDPPTSRSTRLGSTESNLTIAAAKDAEGTSVQITDTAGGDPIRVGFESDAGGDSIIIGNNSYKLGETGDVPTLILSKVGTVDHFTLDNDSYEFTPSNINNIKTGVIYKVIYNDNVIGLCYNTGTFLKFTFGAWEVDCYSVLNNVVFKYIYNSGVSNTPLHTTANDVIPANTNCGFYHEDNVTINIPYIFRDYAAIIKVNTAIYHTSGYVYGALAAIMEISNVSGNTATVTIGYCVVNSTSVTRGIIL